MSTTDIENKIATVDEDHEDEEDDDDDEFAGYSKNLIARLLALRQIQKEHELVDEQYRAERLALEQKYFNERKPLLERRHGIVSGAVEVPIPADVQAASGTDVAVIGDTPAEEDEEKGVPGFWLQCIQNHPVLGAMIQEHDFAILEALNNVTCEYNDDWSGFTLNFFFDENDFFNNAVLTKKYIVDPDLLDDKAPALSEIDGCTIDWKTKKNVCVKETQKKQKSKSGKNKGQTRVITKSEPQPSFFNFFAEPKDTDPKDDEEEEEEAQENPVTFSIDEDYEAAHAFRAELIPEAIYWYTGEASGMDDDEEDDEDFEGDEDDEDQDDDDDEPEEESHDDKGHGHKGGKKNKKLTAPP